jgi:hypothetical protein
LHWNSIDRNAPHLAIERHDLAINGFGNTEPEQRPREGLVHRGHGLVVTFKEIGDDLDLPNVTMVILRAMNGGCEGCVKHGFNLLAHLDVPQR